MSTFHTLYTKYSNTGELVSKPNECRLYQNLPQSFYKIARIKFDIAETSYVRLGVYDEFGKEVCVLVNKELKDGSYEVVWQALNVKPGIYLYKIKAGEFSDTKKTFLLKTV